MQTDIKVSVIVPVYNVEKYIRRTASFISKQTLKDIEIIYVDDGSTDNTVDVLKQLQEEDDRIIILQQNNSYAGVARNKGIEHATGRYLVFWDADDVFYEEALEKMYNKCEHDSADICVCGANHLDETTGKIFPMNNYLKTGMLPDKTPFGRDDIKERLFNFTTNVPWNKMFRTDFVKDHNLKFQEIKRANDNYFVMMALFYATEFTYVDETLIDYRINFESSLTGQASVDPLCVYEAYTKTYETLKDEPGFETVKNSFLNKALRAFFYFLSKQTSTASYELLYNTYKEKVLKVWGFSDMQEDYYSAKDFDRLCRVMVLDANQFLLSEYSKDLDRIRKLKAAKIKLTTKNEKLTVKNEKLKAKNSKLKRKIEELENSTSFKIGKLITAIPGKVKRLFVR
ncbi:MAG: glycosyltransferase [Lachnospiraceae bacterium]|nr:glycosyltransferase [Lachnospiraceae bacterium]